MSQRISMMALLGTVSLTAACGSDPGAGRTGGAAGTGRAASSTGGAAAASGAAGTRGTSGPADAGGSFPLPACTSGENVTCAPSGFPFVQDTFALRTSCTGDCLVIDDGSQPVVTAPPGTTMRLSQPKTGTLCLAGSNPEAGTGLLLRFSSETSGADHEQVKTMFNADELSITQVRFTIDGPPPGGVLVTADSLLCDLCHGTGCNPWRFGLPNPITESGTTTTATLADFTPNSGPSFDMRALDAIRFDVGQGDFDFCVRDFQFFDASGVEVTEVRP